MEKEVLVEVQNVSKKFCTDLKTSLRYGLQDSFRAVLPGNRSEEKTLRKKEFWAVQDVSFTLRRGDCIGLIGHNGAGKSTLLKMINGLIKPDTGKIRLKGKVGALIELGAGFNPILTGRENIYNNAAVLGFSRKEIDAKMDAIIAFSEIEEFLDMPVQNYSSGMKVRLGFSVAVHLEPDILILDEVLAVGDLGFRIKCLNKIGQMINNCAVIFVSHSMPQVSRICNYGMLLEKGKVKSFDKDVALIISKYYSLFSTENSRIIGERNIKFNGATAHVNNESIESGDIINQGDNISIRFNFTFLVEVEKVKCKLFFINNDTRNVLDIPMELNCKFLKINNINDVTIGIKTEPIFLNGGKYSCTFVILDAKDENRLYRHDNIFNITIHSNYYSWSDVVAKAEWSIN